ncbi:Hypothetical predicted protein, partial [Marmota monax]
QMVAPLSEKGGLQEGQFRGEAWSLVASNEDSKQAAGETDVTREEKPGTEMDL